jgi:hypothetical protein
MCLSHRVSRFFSSLCQCHGGADVDGASWDNGLSTHALLVGGDAGTDERFVEPKLLEWLRSGIASWRGGRDVLLLECGSLDCCMLAEEGGGSGRLKGGWPWP